MCIVHHYYFVINYLDMTHINICQLARKREIKIVSGKITYHNHIYCIIIIEVWSTKYNLSPSIRLCFCTFFCNIMEVFTIENVTNVIVTEARQVLCGFVSLFLCMYMRVKIDMKQQISSLKRSKTSKAVCIVPQNNNIVYADIDEYIK